MDASLRPQPVVLIFFKRQPKPGERFGVNSHSGMPVSSGERTRIAGLSIR
jgi:hypothetical protein